MANKLRSKEKITCEILEVYGVLSESSTIKTIYASISWNGNEPKDEIRTVLDDGHGGVVLKGVALSDDAMENLIKAYKTKKKTATHKERKAVNFKSVLQSSEGIMDLRDQGVATEDGFMKLIPKKKIKTMAEV